MNSIITSFNRKIAAPLKFIAFCIKSRQPLEKYGSYLKKSF